MKFSSTALALALATSVGAHTYRIDVLDKNLGIDHRWEMYCDNSLGVKQTENCGKDIEDAYKAQNITSFVTDCELGQPEAILRTYEPEYNFIGPISATREEYQSVLCTRDNDRPTDITKKGNCSVYSFPRMKMENRMKICNV